MKYVNFQEIGIFDFPRSFAQIVYMGTGWTHAGRICNAFRPQTSLCSGSRAGEGECAHGQGQSGPCHVWNGGCSGEDGQIMSGTFRTASVVADDGYIFTYDNGYLAAAESQLTSL